eukprot:TRINITY_DN11029_c0_g1_i3.p1 TRINITY_DN11029_c0_g1~~TRINITY_DN11029_c0_g1_i3.p1  ORF type:complete len:687 (+),score=91.70 TRINITY_DN11029_c0_g1_i3:151-2211(+)
MGVIVNGCSTFIGIVAMHTSSLVVCTRSLVVWAVSAEKFEILMGLIIVCNCLMLGFEAEVFLGNMLESAYWLRIADDVFTLFFTLELFFRVYLYGWRDFVRGEDQASNMFDAALVLMADFMWAFSLLANDGADAEPLIRSFTAFRTVRLMRLVRVVQRVPFFREVLLLLRGLTQSFRVLFWTILVIAAITYVFAIFGVLFVSMDVKKAVRGTNPVHSLTPEQLEMLWELTSGVGTWMHTLIQVLTLDSWNSIMRPLMLVAPWSWLLFYIYIALAVIVLLNLVTAIIVENAFKSSHLEEEELSKVLENERLNSIQQLETLFSSLDDDGSGDISWDEFENGFGKPEIRQQLKALGIQEDELKPLFDLLDAGDGVLTLREFFSGIKRMSGTATAKETYAISKRIEHLCRLAEEINDVVQTATKMGFQHHQPRASRGDSKPCEAVHSDENHSDPISKMSSSTSPLNESSHEPYKFTQSCVSSQFGESELACRVASSTEDAIRKSLDDLDRKLDATLEDFRCRCKTVHRHVAESFASTYGNSDPGSKIVNHRAREVHANDSPSENRSPVIDEKAVAERFGKAGDSPVQAVAPLTCLGAAPLAVSALGVREHVTQIVTEHSCKPETISKVADITASGPVLPNHRPLLEPRKSASIDEDVPEPIVPTKPRCANTAVSSLAPLSLPPAPNADLD